MTMGQHGRAARQLTDDERAALLAAGAQSAADGSERPESADSCSESGETLSDAQGHESRASELGQQGAHSAGGSNEGSIIDDLTDESTASLRQRIASLRVMIDAFVALNPNDWPRVSPSMLRQVCDEAEAQLDAQDDRRTSDTSAALLGELARLGDEYGPLGVALAAALLTDVRALTSRLNDRLPYDVWRDVPLVANGSIGGVAESDPWDWELWIEGGLLTLNMTRPGSGLYEVSTALTVE